MVSNFALCGMPFLAGFYSKDFILETFSMSYVNIFGVFLLFLSTGLMVPEMYKMSSFYNCRFSKSVVLEALANKKSDEIIVCMAFLLLHIECQGAFAPLCM
jgi:NADH-ubiquinone oxidoreductase chain 5